VAAIANPPRTITHYSIFELQSKLEKRGVRTVNKAYIQMIKREARTQKRQQLLVSIFGWSVVTIGGIIGAGIYFSFVYMFLSLGGA
jgi:preprotein translocase subunit YajC